MENKTTQTKKNLKAKAVEVTSPETLSTTMTAANVNSITFGTANKTTLTATAAEKMFTEWKEMKTTVLNLQLEKETLLEQVTSLGSIIQELNNKQCFQTIGEGLKLIWKGLFRKKQ